ncbi:uncharacterized protein DUF1579 [Luteimonas cucumeris]|uniref:Uncharacterized protein DUF1579 n=1 Tax=Luteimonas cucumeris TaxID=985012 RepID=A0A562L770_9GAMM|nr:DUF1579 domain-containing protein [Luteimonas cucumeris]TWI03527.1 uncharacterized protein DUF1579 [Luteimonas cucumeris]
MGKKEFEVSRAEGAHRRMADMAGEWEGTFKLWFEPGDPACESIQRGTIRSILGGRFLLHEYETQINGDAVSGVAIYGYHLDAGAWESAWVESFGTGTQIMHSTGKSADSMFNVLGHYGDGEGGPDWGWRTLIEQPDADTLVIVMNNITPQGDEMKAVETRYARKS